MQCNTSDLPSPMLSTAFNEFEYSAESPLAKQLQFSPLRKLKPLNPPGPPMKVELGLAGRKSPLYENKDKKDKPSGGVTVQTSQVMERKSLSKDAFGTILHVSSVQQLPDIETPMDSHPTTRTTTKNQSRNVGRAVGRSL